MPGRARLVIIDIPPAPLPKASGLGVFATGATSPEAALRFKTVTGEQSEQLGK